MRNILLAVAILVATAPSANAAPSLADDMRDCTEKTADTRIAACTRLINSKKYSGVHLGSLYGWRATGYREKNDHQRSLADCNAGLRLNPKYHPTLMSRGLAHRALKDFDRALADMNQAIALEPRAIYHYYRAETLVDVGDARRAIDDFSAAIRLDAKLQVAHAYRAVLHRDIGEPDLAIADAAEALRLDPRSLYPYYARGFAFVDKGELDRAIADFNEVLVIDPKYAGAYAGRSAAFRLKGDYERAIADSNEAIRLVPNGGGYYLNRANAFRDKGEPERAGADYREVIRLADDALRDNPRTLFAHLTKAIALFNTGRLDDARASIEVAMVRLPRSTVALDTRAKIREAQNDLAGAKADLDALLAIVPGNIEGRKGQARIAAKLAAASAVASASPAATPVQPGVTPINPVALPAAPGKRVALVIGNGAYKAVSALANPRRDAETLAAALRITGFTSVTLASDLTRDALVRALRDFELQAEGADWAMIYFAGHGIEIGGVNYLVPVDAQLKTDRDARDEAVPLDRVLASIENARKLRLVVLDACRDNPFAAQMRRSVATRQVVTRGLAAIEPGAGTIVAYAAKHGQVALDGSGQNSPFVTALVRHMQTPNVEINKVFRLVRDDVFAATSRQQEPFVYGSLTGEDFYFVQK